MKTEIHKQVKQAVSDGYIHFICGFARGSDVLFAEAVAEHKRANPFITLQAAIAHRGCPECKSEQFRRLSADCDLVTYTTELYDKDCYIKRSRYMVDRSALLIAVYDGRQSGGTYETMDYARETGKELRIVALEPKTWDQAVLARLGL